MRALSQALILISPSRYVARGGVAVAVAALMGSMLAAPAGADTFANAPVIPDAAGKCVPPSNIAPVGTVSFHRFGTSTKVMVSTQDSHLNPTTIYSVRLFQTTSPTTCALIATIGSFTTDAWGNGSFVGPATTAKHGLLIDLRNTGAVPADNVSVAVTV